jgi:hypothetical protein
MGRLALMCATASDGVYQEAPSGVPSFQELPLVARVVTDSIGLIELGQLTG